ncbi:MAG: hypothetical protein ACREA0_21750, partial [bacterium]
MSAGADGAPDMERVAKSICDSFKRHLDEKQRDGIQGEFAIGILGFAAVGESYELESRSQIGLSRGLRLNAGSVIFETYSPKPALSSRGSLARIRKVRKEIQNRLAGEKLARYLGEELRDRINVTGVRIQVHDSPGGKTIQVKPQQFRGTRIEGIHDVKTRLGKVKFELYMSEKEGGGRVGLSRRHTRIAEDIASLDELRHSPWDAGQLEGLVHFDALSTAPGSRKGVQPDEAFGLLLEAVKEREPSISAYVRQLEERSEQDLGRELLKKLQEAFSKALRDLSDYSWFDSGPAGSIRTNGRSSGSKAKAVRLSNGPLARLEIGPRVGQLAFGESKKFVARPMDPTGGLIVTGVSFEWELKSKVASMSSDGPVATVTAGASEGDGKLHARARHAGSSV